MIKSTISTQKATAILKKNGFKKFQWNRKNFKNYRTGHYEMKTIHGVISIELYGNYVNEAIKAFSDEGVLAKEPTKGCGLIVVQ